MKKVIIIGGGIAGLAAGIYAQQKGYQTEIHEKNPMAGGECTGWNRRGYHIDNCLHWLTGCRHDDDLYDVWTNLNVLRKDVHLIREPYFYKLEMDGQELHLWRDLDRTREEMLALAPEDEVEIEKLIRNVKRAESMKIACEKAIADMNLIELFRYGASMFEMGAMVWEYGKDNIETLSKRFKSPYIREILRRYYHENFKATTLIASYAFYTCDTAAIPEGGSVSMVDRMVDRYRELGGELFLSSSTAKINIENKHAVSVTLANGEVRPCDYVICATDPIVTFRSLLGPKYSSRNLRFVHTKRKAYKVVSSFNVALGIEGEEKCGTAEGTFIFPCESFRVGEQTVDFMSARMYDYDKQLFPLHKRVIQCTILQDETDYQYWEQLYKDRPTYKAEKERITQDIIQRMEQHFPELRGRLLVLSNYSPVTFTKWCGAFMGSYMSFFNRKGFMRLETKNRIPGLKNVILASQWLQTNGGLPAAATSGKFAAEALP